MFLPPNNLAVCDYHISFVIDCNGLKIAQTAQINQLFQLLSLIFPYGDVTYGLTYMLLSKNDVSEDSPIPHVSLTQSTGPML